MEAAILNCALFLVFVSPRLVAFRNVRYEIQIAVDEDKPFAAVYLEQTELKAGLSRLLVGQQTIRKYELSEALYHDGLRRVLPEATQAQTPFDAYLGEEPFVFVSYSHKDSALVFPEILRLHEQGYRIWYDQGIPIGSNWRGSIGAALRRCAVFLVFVTPRAVASEEVFAEVSIGFERWKKNKHSDTYNLIMVYLESTDLPDDWYVFGTVQGLLPYQTPQPAYQRALDNALDKVKGIRVGNTALEPIAAGTISLNNTSLVEPDEVEPAEEPPLFPAASPDSDSPSFTKQWVKPRRRPNNSNGERSVSMTPKNSPASDSVPVQSLPTVQERHQPTKINPKDGAEMVLIPVGEFLMGDDDLKDNPRRTVTLDGYYIYKNVVTVAQYRKFCHYLSLKMPDAPSWGWQDDHPIVNVNRHHADAYCNWAGGYLPSEAQWEKAARGVDGRKYPWGNEWDNTCLQCSQKKYGDVKSTAPVGSFPNGTSPYGVLDMAGNVSEWCAGWYDEYYSIDSPTDSYPVQRGGSWFDFNPNNFRAAYRCLQPGPTNNHQGFRCAFRL